MCRHHPGVFRPTITSDRRGRRRRGQPTGRRPWWTPDMILRCTSRMLDVIGGKPELIDIGPIDDHWHANVVYIDGKKCVLLVHVSTLFSPMALNVGVLLLRPIGGYVYSQIVRALEREGFPRDALGVIDYHQIHLAPTRSRSVLGSMND